MIMDAHNYNNKIKSLLNNTSVNERHWITKSKIQTIKIKNNKKWKQNLDTIDRILSKDI